jgi:hypothetical protein
MATELIKARYQIKDSEGNVMVGDDGKPVWKEVEVNFDFGDNLQAAVDMCGEAAVFSNYKGNARVSLQSILRAKGAAGLTHDAIQSLVSGWKPGMVIEKTQIDPETAVTNAFETWSPEKQAEFLRKLGVSV